MSESNSQLPTINQLETIHEIVTERRTKNPHFKEPTFAFKSDASKWIWANTGFRQHKNMTLKFRQEPDFN